MQLQAKKIVLQVQHLQIIPSCTLYELQDILSLNLLHIFYFSQLAMSFSVQRCHEP